MVLRLMRAKSFGSRAFFEGVERGAQGVGFCAAMEDQVVALGFDPGDFADVDEVGAGFFADEQTFGEAAVAQDLIDEAAEALFARRRRFCCAARVLCARLRGSDLRRRA